jgi:cation diffusion facilitator CzcD-associated flavoprotein CzcO
VNIGVIGPGHFDVVIVGAGISGIGAAIKLNQMRVTNIAILDKGDSSAAPGAVQHLPALRVRRSLG